MSQKNLPDVVTLYIDGCEHSHWDRYEIDSDMMIPADAWHVTLSQSEISLPPNVVVGAHVRVTMNRETVLQGILDERDIEVSKGHHTLSLSGRDGAGVLLDCSSELFMGQNFTLKQVVNIIVKPLGIRRTRIDADNSMVREKVATEPGENAWDSLQRVAEANGLWPWFEPDGTLVVGGPDYDTSPVAELLLLSDGKSNNVLSLKESSSIVHRFSRVTVYGQSHSAGSGMGERDGQNNIKAVATDDGITSYRPKILFDTEAINTNISGARADKFIRDARIKSYSLIATVVGHRTDGGVLWKPGQRVTVKSEPHGIDGIYFLMARKFFGSKTNGQHTQLTLKEDRMWTLSANPSKFRHRKGRNTMLGQITKR